MKLIGLTDCHVQNARRRGKVLRSTTLVPPTQTTVFAACTDRQSGSKIRKTSVKTLNLGILRIIVDSRPAEGTVPQLRNCYLGEVTEAIDFF